MSPNGSSPSPALGLVLALFAGGAAPRAGAGGCPERVTAAVLEAHPGASITSCRPARKPGDGAFEVIATAPDGRVVGCRVAANGRVLVTEEEIALRGLPPRVLEAFAASHPAARPAAAAERTRGDGLVDYVVFHREGGRLVRATFDKTGRPVGGADPPPGGARGTCPQPRADCVCTAHEAPVICDDDCTYSNACFASCAGQTGCVRAPGD